jgi:hypothetical protein
LCLEDSWVVCGQIISLESSIIVRASKESMTRFVKKKAEGERVRVSGGAKVKAEKG